MKRTQKVVSLVFSLGVFLCLGYTDCFDSFNTNKNNKYQRIGQKHSTKKTKTHISALEKEILQEEKHAKTQTSPSLLSRFQKTKQRRKNPSLLGENTRKGHVRRTINGNSQKADKFRINVFSENKDKIRVFSGKGKLTKSQKVSDQERDSKVVIKGETLGTQFNPKPVKALSSQDKLIKSLYSKRKSKTGNATSINMKGNNLLIKGNLQNQIESSFDKEMKKMTEKQPVSIITKPNKIRRPIKIMKASFFNNLTKYNHTQKHKNNRKEHSPGSVSSKRPKYNLKPNQNKRTHVNENRANNKHRNNKKSHVKKEPIVNAKFINKLKQKPDYSEPKPIKDLKKKKGQIKNISSGTPNKKIVQKKKVDKLMREGVGIWNFLVLFILTVGSFVYKV
jgi:hypothetical protein